MRKFSLLILGVLLFQISNATVGAYTFASSTSNYTAISGTTLYAGLWDDGSSGIITIPFSFTYNGTAYTTLGINANGFITMGSVNTDVYCGLQTSAVNSIAGYGTDLVGASAGSSIQYTTRGSAPNRQFVVQWADCDRYNTGNVNHWNFQIILNETTNTIQVIWGTCTQSTTLGANTCADVATESGSVGLLGASVADFNIRSVINTINTWTASVAGTVISAVCNMSPTNIPSAGLTYTWTPGAIVAMTYTSATTAYLNTGSSIPVSSTGNQVLRVQVVTSGTSSPFSLTGLNLSTTGCTNAGTDLLAAKVYFTGNSSTFSTTTQFGSTVNNPAGAYSVTGSATLSEGSNYFWVTYDIKAAATIGNIISGCCTQVTGSGTMGVRTPTVTCPAGTQSISGIVGSWTAIATPAPHANAGVMLLLPNGTVMAKTSSGGADGYGNLWDILTPDSHGSYVNGTWSTTAAMTHTRLYFSSQVLKDGRVYVAGGEYGTGLQQGEVYNPQTNTWTMTPSPGQNVSDANSEILEDGRVLQALVAGTLKSTVIYNPATNTYAAGPTCNGIHNESAWIKLADNSVLFVARLATTSERYIPETNTWVADATVPVALYDAFGYETGGAVLLPDGRAFFIGSTGHTAIYTPSGSSSPGSWAAGPDVPGGRGAPDAPVAMMVNGKILCVVSAAPTSTNHFPSPSYFYEFDYQANTFTLLNAPGGGTSLSNSCYITNFLDLPDGNVLYSKQGSAGYYIYTPYGAPLANGKPTVTSVTQTACSTYMVKGTLFNGISQGASYGDDWQMSTNYPIVRLVSGTNVYYCRTANWNSTGVRRGASADSVQVFLPAGLPAGTYSLYVVANGISSDAVTFTPAAAPVLSSSLTPTGICSNTAFVYTPASTTPGATFTWTRAAVSGISNAAVSTAQTGNPNEILINTTSTSKTVVYVYTILANGCSNTQNVSVVVKPTSTSSTGISVCSGVLPYVWNGNSYNSNGTYIVHLTSSSGCDSAATLVLTIIASPVAPVGTGAARCDSGTVTISATPGLNETIDWYAASSGGTALTTGSNTFVTPGIIATTNYYAQSRSVITGCFSSSRTMVTATVNSCSVTLNLKLFLSGYYNTGGLMHPVLNNQGIAAGSSKTDTVSVELHHSVSPYGIVGNPVKGVIQTNGTGVFVFPSLSGSYYIVVKHRSAVETWSGAPVTMASSISYDFSTAAAKAFENNQQEVAPGIWAFYNGDLNGDGNVDISDYSIWENAYNQLLSGYFSTDLNGDGNVDGSDYSIWEPNYNNLIYSHHP